MKNNGKRYCKKCKNALRKYGKSAAGNQRWQCVNCKNTKIISRSNLVKFNELKLFVNWLLDKQTIAQNTRITRQAFWKKIKWCWDIIPIPQTNERRQKALLVDAVYIKKQNVCIVLRDENFVIDWVWSNSENFNAYFKLFDKKTEPEFIITDGNPNCLKAIKTCWSDTKIQRCLFHILSFIRSKLSMHPKLEAGQKLLKWTKYLVRVKNKNEAVIQSMRFKFLLEDYNDLLNEKTYVEHNKNTKYKRTWFYTHKNLRAAFRHIKNAFDSQQLFQFIDGQIPPTNNYLEGGINARLKELRRCHRGVSIEHQKRIFDWYLLSRTREGVEDFIKKSTRKFT